MYIQSIGIYRGDGTRHALRADRASNAHLSQCIGPPNMGIRPSEVFPKETKSNERGTAAPGGKKACNVIYYIYDVLPVRVSPKQSNYFF